MPGVQAYCQLNAAATVTMPYGTSTAVRMTPRPKMARCITIATAIPRTSSIATDTTVMSTVIPNACHHRSVDERMVV